MVYSKWVSGWVYPATLPGRGQNENCWKRSCFLATPYLVCQVGIAEAARGFEFLNRRFKVDQFVSLLLDCSRENRDRLRSATLLLGLVWMKRRMRFLVGTNAFTHQVRSWLFIRPTNKAITEFTMIRHRFLGQLSV